MYDEIELKILPFPPPYPPISTAAPPLNALNFFLEFIPKIPCTFNNHSLYPSLRWPFKFQKFKLIILFLFGAPLC